MKLILDDVLCLLCEREDSLTIGLKVLVEGQWGGLFKSKCSLKNFEQQDGVAFSHESRVGWWEIQKITMTMGNILHLLKISRNEWNFTTVHLSEGHSNAIQFAHLSSISPLAIPKNSVHSKALLNRNPLRIRESLPTKYITPHSTN